MADKKDSIIDILDKWLQLKQDRKGLYSYFCNNAYKNIAIYGMGLLGRRLCDELDRTDICIAYIIDKGMNVMTLYDTYVPEDDLPEADAIIVTPVYDFETIRKDLEKNAKCPIISLEDVLYGTIG